MKNWKFKYFEKNIKESHAHIFSSLEIKNYLKKFLNNYELTLNDYRINFSNSTAHIFISVYDTKQKEKELKINKKYQKLQEFIDSILTSKIKITTTKTLLKKIKKSQELQKLINSILTSNKIKMLLKKNKYLKFKKQYKISWLNIQSLDNNKTKLYSFSTKLLEGIKLFLKNKYNIILTVQKLKLASESDLKTKNIGLKLRRFQRASFFKQGVSIIFAFISHANSEKLLLKFIAKELAATKRHKFFLNFLKESLNLMVNQSFSKISGIKLIVTGRLNGVMRANSYVIKINSVPLITLCPNRVYSETTAYTKNGTLGVKLWVLKK